MTRPIPKDLDGRPVRRDWMPFWRAVLFVMWAIGAAYVGRYAGRTEVAAIANDSMDREAHAYRLLEGLLEPCSASLSMLLVEDARIHQRITEAYPQLIQSIGIARAVTEVDR